MRINDRVTYVDGRGKEHAASVTAITGAGKSNWKTLDLHVPADNVAVKDVPHVGDHEKGQGYWLLSTETDQPPERRADPEKQPVQLAIAEETGALPAADRRAPEE